MPSPPRNKETKPSPSPSPLSDVFSFFQPISAAASNAITFATEKLSSPTSSSDKVNTSSQSPLPDFPLFKRSGRSPTHPPGPPRRSSSLPSLYQKNDTPPPPAADPLDSAAQGDVEGTFDFMAKVPSLGMFGLGSFADYSRGISDQGDSDEDYESIESLELQQLDADGKLARSLDTDQVASSQTASTSGGGWGSFGLPFDIPQLPALLGGSLVSQPVPIPSATASSLPESALGPPSPELDAASTAASAWSKAFMSITGSNTKHLRPCGHKHRFYFVEGDLVLLGGMYGSFLSEKDTGKKVWLRMDHVLGWGGEIDVGLSLDGVDERLVPSGILDRIGPINVCADLVREFKAQEACSNGQFRFHPFAYDWRKEPESSSTALEAFLTDIYAKNGGQKITVIAHSMGGLIALSVVNRVPHLFKSVTFVGTPFGGVPLILWQLKRGTPFLAQRNLMTPDLHFGARTSFVFLPTDGKGLVVDGKNGEDDYLVDFYNADEWIRNTLSETLSETTAPETLTKHKNYLTTTLAAAKRFRQSLAYNPALQSHYPPFTHLISSKWPTATRIKCSIAPPPPTEPASTASTTTPTMKPPDRKIDLKYLWPTTFLPGDGVVTRTSMHMPAGFTCHEVESSVGHWAMMNDLRGVRACLKRVTGRVGGVGDAVTEAVKRVVDGGAMPVAPEEVPRSRPLEAAREQEEAGQHGSDAVSAQLAAEEEMIPPPHANESGDVSAEWQEIEAGTVPPAGTKLERESVQRVGQRLREAVSEEHLKGKVSVV